MNDSSDTEPRSELSRTDSERPRRVLLLGATGSIGRAVARALVDAEYKTVALVRKAAPEGVLPTGVEPRVADAMDPESLRRDGIRGESFDTVISCMASRSGIARDAWAVDHQAHMNVLHAAQTAGVEHFVLLSAICVQKPRLPFQHAKLAFEKALRDSGLRWSIVRPTAFFKSISGQVQRVKDGRPFLVFGNGTLTPCKPISDRDTAEFLVGCLTDPERWNRILPVGGPGPALTPLRQGELLFEAAGLTPRFRHVPVALLNGIVGVLTALGWVIPPLREKAELARIGRYYATEAMLVWDEDTGRYDADATPEFGSDTLAAYYGQMVRGEIQDDRGEHAVF